MVTARNRSFPRKASKFGLKALSEITERDIDWIHYPYFARGELTIVEGDPDARKSFFMAAVTRGIVDEEVLPSRFRQLQAEPGVVILFDCENDGETVMRRRFRYLGLEHPEHVVLKGDPFKMVDDDIDEIIDACRDLHPVMAVFDTVNDYFDREANTDKGRDVVQGLQPFKKMAKELNCAVALVRHLTKSTKSKALYRGQGNISYVGKARIVLTVAIDPEDDEVSQMAVAKINIAAKPKALTFRVENRETLKERGAFKFTWGEFIDATADDILGTDRPRGRPSTEREHAKDFLRAELAKGPVKQRVIEQRAESHSIAGHTLTRAADELRIVKSGGPGSTWRLP